MLVVGVGRSGTSLLTGILGQLGLHIPTPEVKADETNPRGFGEPRWVVDFHSRLLRAERVTVNDARPAAFGSWPREPASPRRPTTSSGTGSPGSSPGRRGRREGPADRVVPASVDALRRASWTPTPRS